MDDREIVIVRDRSIAAEDEGPSALQQRYGDELPPSLRWGATQSPSVLQVKHDGSMKRARAQTASDARGRGVIDAARRWERRYSIQQAHSPERIHTEEPELAYREQEDLGRNTRDHDQIYRSELSSNQQVNTSLGRKSGPTFAPETTSNERHDDFVDADRTSSPRKSGDDADALALLPYREVPTLSKQQPNTWPHKEAGPQGYEQALRQATKDSSRKRRYTRYEGFDDSLPIRYHRMAAPTVNQTIQPGPHQPALRRTSSNAGSDRLRGVIVRQEDIVIEPTLFQQPFYDKSQFGPRGLERLHSKRESVGDREENTIAWTHIQLSVLDIELFKETAIRMLSSLHTSMMVQGSAFKVLNDLESKQWNDFSQATSGNYAKTFVSSDTIGDLAEGTGQGILALCMPMFCFCSEPLQHARHRATRDRPQPTAKTLLQELFPRSTSEEASQQTLHYADFIAGYVHITQLWALVVSGGGKDAIITGSVLRRSELMTDTLSCWTRYTPYYTVSSTHDLEIRAIDGRLWLLNRSESQNWFTFQLQLQEIAPGTQLMYKGLKVHSSNWPTIINSQADRIIRLVLLAKDHNDSYSSGVRNQNPLQAETNVENREGIPQDNMQTGSTREEEARNEIFADGIFLESIQQESGTSHSNNPGDCSIITGNAIEQFSVLEDEILAQMFNECKYLSAKEVQENVLAKPLIQKYIFLHFSVIGRLLLNERERHVGTGIEVKLKFWNAWHLFAENISSHLDENTSRQAVVDYINVNFATEALMGLVKQLYRYQYTRIALENIGEAKALHLQKPYQHILLGFLHGSSMNTKENIRAARHCFKDAAEYLRNGFYETLSELPSVSLATKQAVDVENLLGLIVYSCTHNVLPTYRDIVQLYGDRLSSLEQEVWSGEPSREPLKSLRPLRNELKAISIVLQGQIDFLEQLKFRLRPETLKPWGLNENWPDGLPCPERTRALMDDLITAAENRKEVIEQLDALGADLRTQCEAQSADVEDWRSNTVIIFTTVTVIFLPLSFVASVFGINTRDIRNLEVGQWAYWVAAVPFTLLVMAVIAWWVDLISFKHWRFDLSGRRARRRS